ncbi:MAG: META domain-containing protein [Alphaproteobacteria bacterium]
MTNRHAATTAAALALASSLLQACAARAIATPTPVPAAPAAPAAPPSGNGAPRSDLAPLAGTQWTLVELDGKAVGGDRRPTLSIEGSRAAGFAGCNRWGAEIVSTGGDAWALGPVAATRMACDEAEMKFEQRFLAALSGASRWKVERDRLSLVGPDGKIRLAFTGQRQG